MSIEEKVDNLRRYVYVLQHLVRTERGKYRDKTECCVGDIEEALVEIEILDGTEKALRDLLERG